MSKDNGQIGITAGDGVKFPCTVVNQDVGGEPPLDLTPYTTAGGGTFTVRFSPDVDADVSILELTEAGGGVTFPNASGGLVEWVLTTPQSEGWAAGLYHWQARGVDSSGDDGSTLATGKLDVAMLVKPST